MKYINKFCSAVIIYQLFFCMALASESSKLESAIPQSEFNLQEVVLPSEVKELAKSPGSIYYSVSVKNKILIPVNIWGEISHPGLHFIPSDTTLIKGLSLAGGPSSGANLENIALMRNIANGKVKEETFDLSNGGDLTAHQFKIESGDTIFIKKERFYENRGYYTSLINIFITVLSTFVIVNKVK